MHKLKSIVWLGLLQVARPPTAVPALGLSGAPATSATAIPLIACIDVYLGSVYPAVEVNLST